MGRDSFGVFRRIVEKCRMMADYIRKGQWFDLLHLMSRYMPNALMITGENSIMKFSRDKVGIFRKLKKLSVKNGDETMIRQIAECEGKPAKQKFYQKLLDEKRKVYVACYDDDIAGFCWAFDESYTITHDSYRRSNIEMILQPNTCVLGNGYINPKYRLIGIFPHLLAHIVQQKKMSGGEVYALVEHTNVHSFKSHARLGFDVYSTIRYIRLGCLNILRLKRNDENFKYKVYFGKKYTTSHIMA